MQGTFQMLQAHYKVGKPKTRRQLLPVAGETILQGWERRAASALIIFVGDVAQVEVNVPALQPHRYIPLCLTS